MSYEGGGSQGPAGPTGATGATGETGPTGSVDFSGPSNSVLWYDGSGVTGTTGLSWYNGEIFGYVMIGGPNGNAVMFDDLAGNMQITLAQPDNGKSITVNAGNTRLILTDVQTGETGTTGTLEIVINGDGGTIGQYLGADATGHVTWSTPTPIYTVSAYNQTGATGPLINNGPTGTQLMSTSITTGVTGHILGQVSIQIQNSAASEHTVGVYLTVNGSTSGTTTHTIPKQQGGNDGSANLTIFHRTTTKDPPGTYTISVYGYSNSATNVFYDHIDLVGLGNLDGPDASPPL